MPKAGDTDEMGTGMLSAPFFHEAEAARNYLEANRWPNGPECPHCGHFGKAYEVKSRKVRSGVYKCGACRKQFTATIGTVFERSKIPLHVWFRAVYLMSMSQDTITVKRLQESLGVAYQTAWYMRTKLRKATNRPVLVAGAMFGGGPPPQGRVRD